MSGDPIQLGHAAIQLVDHGAGTPHTLDQAVAATAHLADKATKAELAAALAYLGCQVVGYRNRRDQRSDLTMQQVARLVRDWQAAP